MQVLDSRLRGNDCAGGQDRGSGSLVAQEWQLACEGLVCRNDREAGRSGQFWLGAGQGLDVKMLRMVCGLPEQGVKEWFAGRLAAATVGLDSHKHGVNLRQFLGIVESQNPTAIGFVIHIKNA